jgi:hypothetical protein
VLSETDEEAGGGKRIRVEDDLAGQWQTATG